MADAEDLKSSGSKGRAGSSPALGTNQVNNRTMEMIPVRVSLYADLRSSGVISSIRIQYNSSYLVFGLRY